MYNSIVIRNGEVSIKGINRPVFEKRLIKNIRRAFHGLEGYNVYKGDGRIYVDFEEEVGDEIMRRLKNVFGVMSFSPSIKTESGYQLAKDTALAHYNEVIERTGAKTFKVTARREDKSLPMTSPEMSRDIGAYILSHSKNPLKVDVKNPDIHLFVEVREKNNIIYSEKEQGVGGLPVGVNGRAMMLLSGGIDSPVATYMIAKRGLWIEAVHFHSFPFTSEKAKEKIERLAKQLSLYTEGIRIHMVNLLPIQTEISESCPQELMTILSRRFMMRIAEKLALETGCSCLATGESIGQVASQTVEGLQATNSVVKEVPVFRPLISFDKEDIIREAKKIDTFDISIIPEEDCCTVFLPKRPATKPKMEKIRNAEENLDIETLVASAIEEREIREIGMLKW